MSGILGLCSPFGVLVSFDLAWLYHIYIHTHTHICVYACGIILLVCISGTALALAFFAFLYFLLLLSNHVLRQNLFFFRHGRERAADVVDVTHSSHSHMDGHRHEKSIQRSTFFSPLIMVIRNYSSYLTVCLAKGGTIKWGKVAAMSKQRAWGRETSPKVFFH